jgi:hypothetical protein
MSGSFHGDYNSIKATLAESDLKILMLEKKPFSEKNGLLNLTWLPTRKYFVEHTQLTD